MQRSALEPRDRAPLHRRLLLTDCRSPHPSSAASCSACRVVCRPLALRYRPVDRLSCNCRVAFQPLHPRSGHGGPAVLRGAGPPSRVCHSLSALQHRLPLLSRATLVNASFAPLVYHVSSPTELQRQPARHPPVSPGAAPAVFDPGGHPRSDRQSPSPESIRPGLFGP